ncbi:MAG: YceH family protein [Bryobacteraceae bacterium]
MDFQLDAVEARVLGALLEKEIATPEYYPLTLNALQNACNQKSSRDQVVHYDENTVARALDSLKDKGFAVRITGAGHRVEKFGHRLGEKLNLGRREMALLCVLMLRGPQTVGELRGRTERMHDFTDLYEVESVLETLASREPEPLVSRMPRGRWAHLLGGAPPDSPEPQAIRADTPFSDRIDALERKMEEMQRQWEDFRQQFE